MLAINAPCLYRQTMTPFQGGEGLVTARGDQETASVCVVRRSISVPLAKSDLTCLVGDTLRLWCFDALML